MTSADGLDDLLAEQDRACTTESDSHAINLPGTEEVVAALDAFAPTGDVLELACGTGAFTQQLLSHADVVTAADASSERIARAALRVRNDPRASFVVADLFDWRPDRRYDAVVFGFWLSHVPEERFSAFWDLVRDCLVPGGRVFFADDSYRTDDELIEGPESSTIERMAADGTRYRLVKVAHSAVDLERRLRDLGWDVNVHGTAGPVYWGAGTIAPGR